MLNFHVLIELKQELLSLSASNRFWIILKTKPHFIRLLFHHLDFKDDVYWVTAQFEMTISNNIKYLIFFLKAERITE